MAIKLDDRVEEYHKLQNGDYFVKVENNEGLDSGGETSKKNRKPSPLAAFTLSNSKKIMNRSEK